MNLLIHLLTKTLKKREQVYIQLTDEGLKYTNIQIRTKDGLSEKIIFPGALVYYGERKFALQLLKSQARVQDTEVINNSINNLEYEIASAIRLITSRERPKIAILEGHGELDELEMADFTSLLKTQYVVERKKLTENVNLLSQIADTISPYRVNVYDAIIVAKPTEYITEKEKFVLDQFIMRGGRAIWLVDPMNADLDSLKVKAEVTSLPFDLNLDDMFFKYGFRLNKDLLLDANCATIPLNIGNFGDKPQYKIFPWYFFPTVLNRTNHPTSGNIDPVLLQFVSSIDTLEYNPDLKKSVVLETSNYSRLFKSPVRINPSIVSIDPNFTNTNVYNKMVAVIYEGYFNSIFENRLPPTITESNLIQFRNRTGLKNKMLIVSDGDIARNLVDTTKNAIYPLGYDRSVGRKIYGNIEFLMNAVNYILDDADMISTRSRGIKIRKLDSEKIKVQRTIYQLTNIAFPVLAIILLGLVSNYFRNKKYTR